MQMQLTGTRILGKVYIHARLSIASMLTGLAVGAHHSLLGADKNKLADMQRRVNGKEGQIKRADQLPV